MAAREFGPERVAIFFRFALSGGDAFIHCQRYKNFQVLSNSETMNGGFRPIA